jgi:hypothetical protein
MSLPVTQETPAYLSLSFIEDVVSRPGLERRRFGFEQRRMGISKQVPQLLLPILLPLLSSQTIRDLRELELVVCWECTGSPRGVAAKLRHTGHDLLVGAATNALDSAS